MYDVTREELMAAVEAEEREWLSTDDIHPYKSRVPQTKGNTVSFPKITKFNTYLLNHYSAEIVEEINGLLYDGELAAICGVDGFHSQQLTHDRCRIDPRMTFWRVNKYEFTADLVVYLKANAYNDDYSGLQSFTLYVSLDFCIDDRMTYEFGGISLKQPERDRIIKRLKLTTPSYSLVSVYGHFGRTDLNLPWEQDDMADKLREMAQYDY